MTLAAIKRLFTPGQVVTVTNHYITRADHPCFGTRARTVARVSGSHLYFTETGSVEWPKAAQITAEDGTVRFYGGGAGQAADALFLTVQLAETSK